MSSIVVDRVTKRYGQTTAVDDVSLSAESGEFLVLLGPSGCGKSTTLRLIAGLEEPDEGRILIGGKDVTRDPPSRRAISMVFQSYALFPHLDVRENIVFGLKVRKVPAREREERLAKVASLVGLSDYLGRKPAQLSGGQRQRVALARAVIAENPVCLMDEPLSNLDAKLRHEMRIEIRALQQRLGITLIYVTHDQAEAMSMADKVVLMRDGKVEQEDTPEMLYKRPITAFAASFVGTPPMNILDIDRLPDDARREAGLASQGGDARIGIRPEAISLGEKGNGIPATLGALDYLGADTIVTAEMGGQNVTVRVNGHMRGSPGDAVTLNWDEADVHHFDREGRRADARPDRSESRRVASGGQP